MPVIRRLKSKVQSYLFGDILRQLSFMQLTLNENMRLLLKAKIEKFKPDQLTFITDHPYALESYDYVEPKGSIQDFTRSPDFVRQVEIFFDRKISCLDLGCSTGGLVYDFISRSNFACGIEGSDAPKNFNLGFWPIIPEFLFSGDLTREFTILRSNKLLKFDLITAWEVLEHIREEDLHAFFGNVSKHLSSTGVFIASVAQFSDRDPKTGREWHVTIRSKDWWSKKFSEFGFVEIQVPNIKIYPRGCGNRTAGGDWDARTNPQLGFHIILQKTR